MYVVSGILLLGYKLKFPFFLCSLYFIFGDFKFIWSFSPRLSQIHLLRAFLYFVYFFLYVRCNIILIHFDLVKIGQILMLNLGKIVLIDGEGQVGVLAIHYFGPIMQSFAGYIAFILGYNSVVHI